MPESARQCPIFKKCAGALRLRSGHAVPQNAPPCPVLKKSSSVGRLDRGERGESIALKKRSQTWWVLAGWGPRACGERGRGARATEGPINHHPRHPPWILQPLDAALSDRVSTLESGKRN